MVKLLLLVILLFLVPSRLLADIVFDVATSVDSGAATAASLNWSHTVTESGGNRVIYIAMITRGGQTSPSATYGGNAATLLCHAAGTGVEASLHRLIDPPTGSNTAVCSQSDSRFTVCAAVSFTNVDQTTPEDTCETATGSASPAAITISSAAGDLVYAVSGKRNSTETPTADGTQRWQDQSTSATAANNVIGTGSTKPGDTSVTPTHSWTGSAQFWAMAGININNDDFVVAPTRNRVSISD